MSNTMSNNNSSSLMATNIGRVSALAFIAAANVVVTPVEAYSGQYIQCKTKPLVLQANEWVPYDSYPGEYNQVRGSVLIKFEDGELSTGGKLSWNLQNLNPGCETDGCGIHVHWGVSCEADNMSANVKGHMYDQGSDDDWINIKYKTDKRGKSKQSKKHPMGFNDGVPGYFHYTRDLSAWDNLEEYVDLGEGAGTNPERLASGVMVLHDFGGDKMACSEISVKKEDMKNDYTLVAREFKIIDTEAYPNLNKEIEGSVEISFPAGEDSTWGDYSWDFNITEGARAVNCTSTFNGDNSCGIHVHWGVSCQNLKGHMFAANWNDPWGKIHFDTDCDGKSKQNSYWINDGVAAKYKTTKSESNIKDDDSGVIVLHAYESANKFACSPIRVQNECDDW